MADNAKWYVIHTYSGYENAVAASIEKAAENRRMTDLIQAVSIPMETVTEITDSKAKTVERKVFPGYVLVKMVMTDESWHRGRAGRGEEQCPRRSVHVRQRDTRRAGARPGGNNPRVMA